VSQAWKDAYKPFRERTTRQCVRIINTLKNQNLLVRLVLTKLNSALQTNLPLQYSANQWNISPRKGGLWDAEPALKPLKVT